MLEYKYKHYEKYDIFISLDTMNFLRITKLEFENSILKNTVYLNLDFIYNYIFDISSDSKC